MKTVILLLIDTLETIGGTERQFFELIKRLDQNKYASLIFSLGEVGPFSCEIEKYGIPVTCLSINKVFGPRGIRALKRMRKVIEQENVRLVHAFHFGSQLLGFALAKMTHKPLIYSIRDCGFWQTRKHRIISKYINNRADKIIAVSKAVEQFIKKQDRVAPQKITVIYNGVELDKFVSNTKKEQYIQKLQLSCSVPVVAYIGWLRPEKGVEYFIEAAQKVIKLGHQAQFLIIGNGPLRDSLESKVKLLKLQNNVRFLGDRIDIPELLSVIDISVLPSLTEGFSNTLIEGMAAGKAIIATAVGGNHEAVLDGQTGVLVPPGDSDSLASATIGLLKDEGWRKTLGEEALKMARQMFDIRQVVLQHQSVYDSLLGS